MAFKYEPVTPSDLKLYSEVRFRYLNGKEVLNVIGWIYKIDRKGIRVGNESHLENNGLQVYHSKDYQFKKIEYLEMIVSSS
ncbi:hypothetical protein KY314_02215 [Candidatus Woesearchaeota archaeon]|nr:hypothetical protein [Candidatus Woesearchaeota archaeon]